MVTIIISPHDDSGRIWASSANDLVPVFSSFSVDLVQVGSRSSPLSFPILRPKQTFFSNSCRRGLSPQQVMSYNG